MPAKKKKDVEAEPALAPGYMGNTVKRPEKMTLHLRQEVCPHCGNGYLMVPYGIVPEGMGYRVENQFCSSCGKDWDGDQATEIPTEIAEPHPESEEGEPYTGDTQALDDDDPVFAALTQAAKARG